MTNRNVINPGAFRRVLSSLIDNKDFAFPTTARSIAVLKFLEHQWINHWMKYAPVIKMPAELALELCKLSVTRCYPDSASLLVAAHYILNAYNLCDHKNYFQLKNALIEELAAIFNPATRKDFGDFTWLDNVKPGVMVDCIVNPLFGSVHLYILLEFLNNEFVDADHPWHRAEIYHLIDFLERAAPINKIARYSVPDAMAACAEWDRLRELAASRKKKELLEFQAEDELCLLFPELQNTEYYVVELLTQRAYEREGMLMRHCVGSYWREPASHDMAFQEPRIWSLRKQREPKPLLTLEMDTHGFYRGVKWTVVQAQGPCNTEPKGESARALKMLLRSPNVLLSKSVFSR